MLFNIALAFCSLIEVCGILLKITTFIIRFIHYIYKSTPTYWVILPSSPTRETKVQFGMV